MNLGEAHEIVSGLERDVASVQDHAIAAWYEVESKLQPEFKEASAAMDQVDVLAQRLGQVLELKKAGEITPVPEDTEGISESDIVEEEPILTPEEKLHNKIRDKYERCYEQYEEELENITATKRSKREREERAARRNFARGFTDFSDVTGDEHIVLDAESFVWAMDELVEDEALAEEITQNSVKYTEHHGGEVTADPKNFAAIIAGSVSDEPSAQNIEKVLAAVFAQTPENIENYWKIHTNLAEAAFESLDNFEALVKIASIGYLREPYVPSAFAYEIAMESGKARIEEDAAGIIDRLQASVIISTLNHVITGASFGGNEKMASATERFRNAFDTDNPPPTDNPVIAALDEIGKGNTGPRNYDPIRITAIENGDELALGGLEAMPEILKGPFSQSSLYRKRMQHLAPYSYGIAAARKILDGGVHGMLVPLSPSISADAFIPNPGTDQPSPYMMVKVSERIKELQTVFLKISKEKEELGISSYEAAGEVGMIYMDLFDDPDNKAIVVIRPSVPLDKRKTAPLQQLNINYMNSLDNAETSGEPLPKSAEYIKENQDLREQIQAEQKRFLGRRPVKFAMPKDLNETGLDSVHLRYDPETGMIKSLFRLDDGEVELDLDRDYNIDMSAAPGAEEHYEDIRLYYENLILKLVKIWSTSYEVRTSEGIVGEGTGNTANMGHFAYLRISGGRKYEFSERQREICMEEQARDLAVESERLAAQDPTGQGRNSTYVRENFDPNKPPLEVYYASLGEEN